MTTSKMNLYHLVGALFIKMTRGLELQVSHLSRMPHLETGVMLTPRICIYFCEGFFEEGLPPFLLCSPAAPVCLDHWISCLRFQKLQAITMCRRQRGSGAAVCDSSKKSCISIVCIVSTTKKSGRAAVMRPIIAKPCFTTTSGKLRCLSHHGRVAVHACVRDFTQPFGQHLVDSRTLRKTPLS